jgi:hypothetical protein
MWSSIISPMSGATDIYVSNRAAFAQNEVWIAGKYEDTSFNWLKRYTAEGLNGLIDILALPYQSHIRRKYLH